MKILILSKNIYFYPASFVTSISYNFSYPKPSFFLHKLQNFGEIISHPLLFPNQYLEYYYETKQ